MSGTTGANIAELAKLGQSFQRQSQTVRELSNQLSGLVSSTYWVGTGADRFKSQWDSEFKPMLARLEQELEAGGREVLAKKAQFEQANR